jgi:UDP-GlcNAc:undecaprenyl-phosphate GlcNAc-1-phosphate transferase
MSYLLAFVACLFLSLLLTRYVRNLAIAKCWVDAPKAGRHLHVVAVPRLGGVAIYVSFMVIVLLALAAHSSSWLVPALPVKATVSLLGPASLIFLLGLYDDFHSLGPFWKFGIQTIAAVWLYAGGIGIHRLRLVSGGHDLNAALGLLLTVIWVLLITNAFNLIDGLDGLAAGSALFSTLVVFVMSLIVPSPLVTLLSITLAGATLGFLRFNFHPASIFLGDSGSLFIGFMISALALVGSQKAPTMVAVAIPMVSLGFPIMDVVLAVVRRFLAGKPLFNGDGHHIHHKLLKRGLSQRNAVLVLYAVTAGFGFLSLVLLQDRRMIALVLGVIGIGIFLGIQQLRYQEFAELLSSLQGVGRHRQVLANHVAIRHAAELLDASADFSTVCEILRDTLEPIGFDAVRFRKAGENGFPAQAHFPLPLGPDGSLIYSWSEKKTDEAPWELKFELVTNSGYRWGYFSLLRVCGKDPLPLDVNILTDNFRTSLSNALDRAFERMVVPPKAIGGKVDESHTLAVGSAQ